MTKYQKELDAWLLANCFKGQETQYIEKPSKSVFEVVHELFDQSPLFEFFGIRDLLHAGLKVGVARSL